MKKIVGLVLLAAVVLAPLFAIDATKSYPRVKAPLYLDNMNKGDAPSVINDPSAFDNSSNGYGWYNPFNHKIDFDPITQTYGTFYRQKSSAGSGSGGFGIAYTNDDSFETSPIYPNPAGIGGLRYPYITSGYGYHFLIGTEYGASSLESKMMIFVNSPDDIETVGPIYVGNSGEFLPGWMVAADITFNEATGEYILIITGEYDLNSDPFKTGVVVGKTTTPMDPDSWEFSDYNDLLFVAGESFPDAGTLKPVWGKNGLGVVLAPVDAVAGDFFFVPGMIYTTDWGATWNLSETGGFIYDTTAFGASFSWDNATCGDPAEDAMPTGFGQFDAFIDDNNTLHFVTLCHAKTATSGTSYYPWATDAGGNLVLTDGYYDTQITIADGEINFVQSDLITTRNYTWDNGEVNESSPRYVNHLTASVGATAGYPNSGAMYLSIGDRIFGDTGTDLNMVSEWTDPVEFYYFQPHSVTKKAGSGWETEIVTVEIEEGVFQDFPIAYNVFDEPGIHHEGLSTPSLVPEMDGDNLTVWGVYQVADLTQPLSGAADFCDHVQDLYSFTWNKVGIEELNNVPGTTALAQNYPNPFNPATQISFRVDNAANINLTVFNAAGEKVSELVNGNVNSGIHTVNFDASNLNSGVYFYQLSVNGVAKDTKKMVLTK
ncbi:MAG: T9SS type A sorting domain-containing protein [Candidatus Delongbacteria bacterium]|nr:T9SS type A sorting domain-containing protein [Candidatus Delongbacteria bacterium]MBN2834951.1 T9SS type A sorting domain-containing protein [Candidatus Delongbacteria bacterium]